MVGSRLGGIPEIVDRYSAVAPLLPEKIAEAVVKVLGAHYDREEMRLYAHKKFGVENVERLVEIFNKVAGSRG